LRKWRREIEGNKKRTGYAAKDLRESVKNDYLFTLCADEGKKNNRFPLLRQIGREAPLQKGVTDTREHHSFKKLGEEDNNIMMRVLQYARSMGGVYIRMVEHGEVRP